MVFGLPIRPQDATVDKRCQTLPMIGTNSYPNSYLPIVIKVGSRVAQVYSAMLPLIYCDLADPRLDVFRDLKFPKLSHYFVTEGRLVTERLLTSQFPTDSILIAERRIDWIRAILDDPKTSFSGPVFVVPDEQLDTLVGFQFHSGILGAGRRLKSSLDSDKSSPLQRWLPESEQRQVFAAFPHLSQADNLGSIARTARGLKCAGLLLDSRAPDPLSRRVLRVSMGHSMYLPIYQSQTDLIEEIEVLKEMDFKIIAVEVHPNMVSLDAAKVHPRQVLVLGNEFSGVPPAWLDAADQIVGIPMAAGVDSLNVAVTFAIALHHFGN